MKNARENNEISTPATVPSRSNGMAARANLTPLKSDVLTHEKIRQINNIIDERKRRVDRLDPIQF